MLCVFKQEIRRLTWHPGEFVLHPATGRTDLVCGYRGRPRMILPGDRVVVIAFPDRRFVNEEATVYESGRSMLKVLTSTNMLCVFKQEIRRLTWHPGEFVLHPATGLCGTVQEQDRGLVFVRWDRGQGSAWIQPQELSEWVADKKPSKWKIRLQLLWVRISLLLGPQLW